MKNGMRNAGLVLAGTLAGITGTASIKPTADQMQEIVLESYRLEPAKHSQQIKQGYEDYHSLVGQLYENMDKKVGSPLWGEINQYAVETPKGVEMMLDYNEQSYRIIKNGEGVMLESTESTTLLKSMGEQVHNLNATFMRQWCNRSNKMAEKMINNSVLRKGYELEYKRGLFWNKLLGRDEKDMAMIRESYGIEEGPEAKAFGGNENE